MRRALATTFSLLSVALLSLPASADRPLDVVWDADGEDTRRGELQVEQTRRPEPSFFQPQPDVQPEPDALAEPDVQPDPDALREPSRLPSELTGKDSTAADEQDDEASRTDAQREQAIRDFMDRTGRKVGMKPAGGISTAKLAIQYLVMVKETLGAEWLSNDRFRFGASSLTNDLLMQIRKQQTGRYQSGDYFTKD